MRLICTVLTLTLVSQLLAQPSNSTVIEELNRRLSNLSGHTKIKSNLSVSDLKVPSYKMKLHAECCVPEFKSLLLDMLNNVTVTKERQHYTTEIINDLDRLLEEKCANFNTTHCLPTKMGNTLHFEPFTQYKIYLTKLNMKRSGARKRRG